MATIRLSNFEGGLFLGAPPDKMPQGTLRRALGLHDLMAGRLRTRNGKTLITSGLGDIHSLYRFDSVRFIGEGVNVKRNGSNVLTNQDGTRLAFVSMQVGLGVTDFLFVAGGGALRKIDKSGTATAWGKSGAGVTVADVVSGSVFWPAGLYKAFNTFYSSVSGYESNPGGGDDATLNGTTENLQFTLGSALDSYFDFWRVYCTTTDGSEYFLLATVSSSPYTHSATTTDPFDDLDTDSPLLTDNAKPANTYEDVAGPHVGRLWWGRVNADGERGRVYFSPIGRPESVQGFIELAADDDHVQKLVIYGGQLFAFTTRGISRIDGLEDAFAFSRVPGALGTSAPFTVVATTRGVFYLAADGVRVFDGSTSELVGFDALGILFRGESVDDGYHGAIEGIVGGYYHDHYLISNGPKTYALNVKTGAWREPGYPAKAFYYEDETDLLIVGDPDGGTYIAEAEGVFTDDGLNINFEWETPHIRANETPELFVRGVRLDAVLNNQTVKVDAVIDGLPFRLANISGGRRRIYDLPVNRSVRQFALRLHGSCNQPVEVNAIDLIVP